jgi:hypothetical protein
MNEHIIKDRFVLEAPLTATRYLTIYRAVDTVSGPDSRRRRVLLWLFAPAIGEDADVLAAMRSRFARLAALLHPNLAGVYELSNDGDRYFAIGEFVEAETLKTVLENLEPESLDHAEVDEVLTAVAAGLAYAHDHGVTHGDVCSDNVLVTTDSEIKLAGFLAVPGGSGTYTASVYEDVRDFAALAFELYTGVPYRDGAEARIATVPVKRRIALMTVLTRAADGYGPATVREFMVQAGLAAAAYGGPDHRSPAELVFPAPQRLEVAPAVRQRGGWARTLATLVVIAAIVSAVHWRDEILGGLDIATLALAPETTAPVSRSAGEERLAASVVDPGPRVPSAVGTETGRIRAAQPDSPGLPLVGGGTYAPGDEAPANAGPADDPGADPDPVPETPPVAGEADSGGARPVVSLTSATATAYESRRGVTLQAKLVGEAEGPVEIVWWTSDGTALAGDDYASFGRRIEAISSRDSTATLYVPLTQDVIAEPRKRFYVHIEAATDGVEPGAIMRAEVTLIDDDT